MISTTMVRIAVPKLDSTPLMPAIVDWEPTRNTISQEKTRTTIVGWRLPHWNRYL